MSTELEEYADEQTGTRMTIERDYPDWPRVTIILPEPCTLTVEEINEAVHRLVSMANLPLLPPMNRHGEIIREEA